MIKQFKQELTNECQKLPNAKLKTMQMKYWKVVDGSGDQTPTCLQGAQREVKLVSRNPSWHPSSLRKAVAIREAQRECWRGSTIAPNKSLIDSKTANKYLFAIN